MSTNQRRGETKRRRKKYRIKKRFYVFLLILILCAAGMVKCTAGLLGGEDGGSDENGKGDAGTEGGENGIKTTAIADTDPWKLTLVNKEHKLASDFSVETAAIEGNSGYSFDSRAVGSLNQMLADAKAAGLEVVVCSGYRSIEYQETLIKEQVAKYVAQGMSQAEAETKTATEIIEPGASEHNLGLAVDLVAKSYQHLETDQEETAENKWLQENCMRYGFILRYPKDKQEITGIIYEPWHFRYVGVAAAKEIMEQKICLEEYLGKS